MILIVIDVLGEWMGVCLRNGVCASLLIFTLLTHLEPHLLHIFFSVSKTAG